MRILRGVQHRLTHGFVDDRGHLGLSGHRLRVGLCGQCRANLGMFGVRRGDRLRARNDTAHREADGGLTHVRLSEFRDDRAAEHDEESVRQRHDLVEVSREQQHGCSRVTLADDRVVHELHCADVDTPRGLSNHEQIRLGREFTRDDDLLHVAAGERADRSGTDRAAHVEGLNQAPGK